VSDVLGAIAAVVAARRDADPETSYVASLNAKGIDKILEKVGEEKRRFFRVQPFRGDQ